MRLHPVLSTRQIVLLPPQTTGATENFRHTEQNAARYTRLLGNMQRLRGRIYLADGAIEPSNLAMDGRHRQAADPLSWHVLSIDSKDNVYGCARLRPYEFPFDYSDLSVRTAEIAHSDIWAGRLERAIRSEIERAQQKGVGFVEVGGWALSEEVRCSTEALRIALAMYGLGQVLGGCIGLTTATVRHCSSAILRRIGGALLNDGTHEIPRYFDTRYKCEMEILRFDSSEPTSKFRDWVADVTADLHSVHVIGGTEVPAAAAAAAGREGFGSLIPSVVFG